MLVAILKKLSPGLAVKDLVPIFTCFCFAKDSVHSYDNSCCLRMPAKLGITGGVRGELFLSWLNACKSKEIEITQGENTITAKAGRTKFESAIMAEDEFLFSAPDLAGAVEITPDTAFLAALTKAALSMGRDASATWRYGCTLVPYKSGGYALYATNDKTITKATVGKPAGEPEEAVILSPRFVDLLLAQSKDDAPKKMSIAPAWGEVRFNSGLKLFTPTFVGADPAKYEETLGQVDAETKGKAVEIPAGLDRCLERATLVTKFSKAPVTRLVGDGERLRFETRSEAGDVNDSIACEHGAVDVYVAPELLQPGLAHAGSLAIAAGCVKLFGPGYKYLVCTGQSGNAETAESAETAGPDVAEQPSEETERDE